MIDLFKLLNPNTAIWCKTKKDFLDCCSKLRELNLLFTCKNNINSYNWHIYCNQTCLTLNNNLKVQIGTVNLFREMNYIIYDWYNDIHKSTLPNICYAISCDKIIGVEEIFEFDGEEYYISENGNICRNKDNIFIESASLVQRMINKKNNIKIIKNKIDRSKYDYPKKQ